MRVRIKFSKNGAMKYLGHLDVMRYFQKALRRAEIPVKLSEGFSPHMLMSFAAPLGVGVTSDAEYFDVDIRDTEKHMTSAQMTEALQAQMAEGFSVSSVRQIGETKADKGMTLVAAAAYAVSLRSDASQLPGNTADLLEQFLQQDQILVMRKTKRKEEETDIRPWIYQCSFEKDSDGTGFFKMLLSSGSVHNLKPQLVVSAFAAFAGLTVSDEDLRIHRLEIYADPAQNGNFLTLENLGKEIF